MKFNWNKLKERIAIAIIIIIAIAAIPLINIANQEKEEMCYKKCHALCGIVPPNNGKLTCEIVIPKGDKCEKE